MWVVELDGKNAGCEDWDQKLFIFANKQLSLRADLTARLLRNLCHRTDLPVLNFVWDSMQYATGRHTRGPRGLEP